MGRLVIASATCGDIQANQCFASARNPGNKTNYFAPVFSSLIRQFFNAARCHLEIPLAGIKSLYRLNRVVCIKGTSRLDDCWGRMIWCVRPLIFIECRAGDLLQRRVNCFTEAFQINLNWPVNIVCVHLKCGCPGFFAVCRYQNRHKRSIVTGLVKVFQIQRIIPNLLNCRSLEFFFANLEFHHEHHRTNEQHRINSAAHARDVKFQIQRAG